MKLRILLMVLITVFLAACSNQAQQAPTATPQVIPEATVELELTQTYTFDLGWGGQVAFGYPETWEVRVQRSMGVYGGDGFDITIAADNNPNGNNDAQSQLDRLNQSSEILTTEVNGVTIYYSSLTMSNRYTATVQLNEHTYGLLQMINTRSRDLEPMLPTFFKMAASMRLIDAE